MPTYKQGNMWYCLNEVDHFIITTNAIVKRNGALVMGAGIAKQVRDNNRDVDKACGKAILDSGLRSYGLLLNVSGHLGLFQVKHHFAEAAKLDLIQFSMEKLRARAIRKHKETYALNFPGIGNGKLNYNQVKPIIDQLPDNVQVWTFA